MRAIQLPPPSPEQIEALEALYHTTKDVRLRTRSHMMLLAAERQIEGLKVAPRSGATPQVTAAYEAELVRVVRLRSRSMGLEFSRSAYRLCLSDGKKSPPFAHI